MEKNLNLTGVVREFREGLKPAATMDSGPGQHPPMVDTLYALLSGLDQFSRRLIDYFEEGFTSGGGYKLRFSADEPKGYVYQLINNQIARDLDVITRIYSQRISDDGNAFAPNMRKTLRIADQLAYQALVPAITSGLAPSSTVLTYFQQSIQVRIIPYAPIALIGIPFEAMHDKTRLLSIAHEVGHYVYRYTKFYLHDQIQKEEREGLIGLSGRLKEPKWYSRWLEETFADIYGCLIAGPPIALSAQEMSMRVSPKEFSEENGRHPTPAIRPRIYTSVLRYVRQNEPYKSLVDESLDKTINMLEQNWANRVEYYGGPRKVAIPHQSDKIYISLAQKIICNLVKDILDSPISDVVSSQKIGLNDALLPSNIRTGWTPPFEWHTTISSSNLSLESTFGTAGFEDLEAREVPTLKVIKREDNEIEQIEITGQGQLSCELLPSEPRPLTLGNSIFDELNEQLTPADGSVILPEEWTQILSFGSWTDGPGGPPNLGG